MEEGKRYVFLGLIFVAGVLCFLFLLWKVSGMRAGRFQKYWAVFDSAKGLVEKADIRIAGVRVGYVSEIAVDFDKAKVELMIKDGVDLREDAQAQIRAKSLLGEKYVEIIPGSRDAAHIKPGFIIKRTETLFDIDDMLMSMKPVIMAMDPKTLEDVTKNLPELMISLKKILDVSSGIINQVATLTPQFTSLIESSGKAFHDMRIALDLLNRNSGVLEDIVRDFPSLLTKTGLLMTRISLTLDQFSEAFSFFTTHRENLSESLKLTPEVLKQFRDLARDFGDMVPEFSKLLTETSFTLQELRKVLKEGAKVKFF